MSQGVLIRHPEAEHNQRVWTYNEHSDWFTVGNKDLAWKILTLNDVLDLLQMDKTYSLTFGWQDQKKSQTM